MAADVCRALELTNTPKALERLDADEKMTITSSDSHSGQRGGTPAKAIERLDGDEKGMSSIHTPGGKQEMTIVNEPGLYSLVRGNGRQVLFSCDGKDSGIRRT